MLTDWAKRMVPSSAAAAVALALAMPLASAATPFDGTWVIDVPASGLVHGTSDSTCPALRFPVRIKDGRVTGMLTRVPARDGELIVEAGAGPDAAPLIGSVQSDGAVQAAWQGFHASGMLHGNSGVVTVNSECGPLTAKAVRVQ